MTEKRARGRPVGTGTDDQPHLSKIAQIMVSEGIKKPTTAMRLYMRRTNMKCANDTTVIRRWQSKWKGCGADLMQKAANSATSKRSSDFSPSGRNLLEEIATGNIPSHVAKLFYSKEYERMMQPSFIEEMTEKQRFVERLSASGELQKMFDKATEMNRLLTGSGALSKLFR